jgi:hypothetical protein
MPLGGTSSNGAQWANHGAADIVGKDCVTCHAADAKTSGSAWSKSDSFHAVITKPVACQGCHGLNNGLGSVAGTNNNLPAGLTNSTTVTTAASDATTGVAAGTLDQITHTDLNVSGRDCNFCHTQSGPSTVAGTMGKEWAKAAFHVNFTAANPLQLNGTTARCSNCHMNVKPGPGFAGQDHSTFTSASGTTDCYPCHNIPGTGTITAPNWLGAAGGVPPTINVGNFPVGQPPATSPTTQTGINALPHPTVGSTPCAKCHTGGVGGTNALGYDHASALINSNCGSCHETGSNLVSAVWNSAATEAAGTGDTRPIGLTKLNRSSQAAVATIQIHYYPTDCHECHSVPTAPAAPGGIGTATTGGPYEGVGIASGATCLPSGATCPSTGVACSNTAPCPTGQSCRSIGAGMQACQINCPSGQSCQGGSCIVDCPNNQNCSGTACYYSPFWYFPHTQKNMTNPTTCCKCHPPNAQGVCSG